MNAASTRGYHSPLRQAQAEGTRVRVLEAVARLLERGPDEALSFGAVAREAGVQERTVYRHFPSKEALLDAFWAWVNERFAFGGMPQSEEDLVERPREIFAGFDQSEGVIRAMLRSPQGREIRLRANEARQEAFRRSLEEATRGLDEETARRAHATVQLLYSAAAWQSMKDYWGLSGEEAGEAAGWAISALLTALREGHGPRTDDQKEDKEG